MYILTTGQKGHMEVTHVDRIGHDQLSKNSLLHILSVTKNRKGKNIYKYLYPNMENCENLLEGNVTKGKFLKDDKALLFSLSGSVIRGKPYRRNQETTLAAPWRSLTNVINRVEPNGPGFLKCLIQPRVTATGVT